MVLSFLKPASLSANAVTLCATFSSPAPASSPSDISSMTSFRFRLFYEFDASITGQNTVSNIKGKTESGRTVGRARCTSSSPSSSSISIGDDDAFGFAFPFVLPLVFAAPEVLPTFAPLLALVACDDESGTFVALDGTELVSKSIASASGSELAPPVFIFFDTGVVALVATLFDLGVGVGFEVAFWGAAPAGELEDAPAGLAKNPLSVVCFIDDAFLSFGGIVRHTARQVLFKVQEFETGRKQRGACAQGDCHETSHRNPTILFFAYVPGICSCIAQCAVT